MATIFVMSNRAELVDVVCVGEALSFERFNNRGVGDFFAPLNSTLFTLMNPHLRMATLIK